MNPLIQSLGIQVGARKLLTLSGNAGAHEDNIFLITTPVEIVRLWGVVETALAAGLTASFWDLWDGTISIPLTLNTGVVSSLPAKSLIVKQDAAATVMTVQSAATGALVELVAGLPPMQPVIPVPKSTAATYVRFRYTSAGVASGAIRFGVEYRSLGSGGISPV
jgi:hypothetical protein